jgi:hypothetical protein
VFSVVAGMYFPTSFGAYGSRMSTARTPARAGSPWNTPFAALGRPVPIRRDSRRLAADLVRQQRYGLGVEQRRWTSPVYVVRSTSRHPRRRIHLLGTAGRRTDPRTGSRDAVTNLAFMMHRGIEGRGWPIPRSARPDPSGAHDGHMTIYVEDTGQLVELYRARRTRGGNFTARWGGYVHDARRSPGHYADNSARSLEWSHRTWGPLAGSSPMVAGLLWEHEVREAYAAYLRGDHEAAYIPHAIGVNIHAHTRNTWVWPAQRTDGTIVYGRGGRPLQLGPIAMGQIFKLPEAFDVRSLSHGSQKDSALLQIIARTIQRHGMIVWDQSGGGFKLRAEQVRRPDGRLGPMFDYGNADRWLRALPMHLFQAVETRQRVRGHYRPPR